MDRRSTDHAWLKRALLLAGSLLMAASAAIAQETPTPTSPALPRNWIPQTPAGLVPEPRLLRKLVNASDGSLNSGGDANDGLYVDLGNMVAGAGWISAGPGYRRHVLDGRALVDVSAALSWNLYQAAQARFELPHVAHDRLTVGAQARYQDLLQVDFFGLGSRSPVSDRSDYRFRDLDILGYAALRARSWLSVSGRAGWMPQPDLLAAGGRSQTFPNTIDRFTEDSAPGIAARPAFLHGDVSVAADWRDHAGHPTGGGLYRLAAATYQDRDEGRYSFRRYEVEASQYIPLGTKRWILALHGWEVFSDTSNGSVVPFYLMPSLGGQNTLRGFNDYRFHDNDMQEFNAESRIALFSHVDAAVFADAGKVAARAGDLDFARLRRAYGAGLRVHNATSTLLRLDIGHSTEGWQVFLKMNDPFKRSAPAYGRSSVVPFVP